MRAAPRRQGRRGRARPLRAAEARGPAAHRPARLRRSERHARRAQGRALRPRAPRRAAHARPAVAGADQGASWRRTRHRSTSRSCSTTRPAWTRRSPACSARSSASCKELPERGLDAHFALAHYNDFQDTTYERLVNLAAPKDSGPAISAALKVLNTLRGEDEPLRGALYQLATGAGLDVKDARSNNDPLNQSDGLVADRIVAPGQQIDWRPEGKSLRTVFVITDEPYETDTDGEPELESVIAELTARGIRVIGLPVIPTNVQPNDFEHSVGAAGASCARRWTPSPAARRRRRRRAASTATAAAARTSPRASRSSARSTSAASSARSTTRSCRCSPRSSGPTASRSGSCRAGPKG